MKSKRNVLLASCVIPILIGSCGKTVIQPDLPCPPRPVLAGIPDDLQLRTPGDVLVIAAENQLRLKQYAKQLESRANCEDR